MADIGFLKDAVLVREAGPLWDEATHSPFLDALASGTLPAEPFRRWLAQDYLFARALMSYQATLLAKAPRDAHKALVAGLAALDSELAWFEGHASRLQVDLAVTPHPVCRRYMDFLLASLHWHPHPVLQAILFGVEAAYLTAWSALPRSGPHVQFIDRWSSEPFASYVASLLELAERYPHEAAQEHFNLVLAHERDFWTMSWKGDT